jgi:hypothetical protein
MIVTKLQAKNKNRKESYMENSNTTIESVIAEERKAYFKEWRAKNKDKVKQHNQNYWRKRAEQKLAEQQKAGDE